jgi:hypothetical protein
VNWFRGSDVVDNDDVLIFKTQEIVKGRQRLAQQSSNGDASPKKQEDLF